MQPNLLILGGTSEATSLAQIIAKQGIKATISYAGRVEHIKEQALPKRIGGFGGVAGLKAYLETQHISHVIDATHPFAAQMSWHVAEACRQLNLPLLALSRPPWTQVAGDNWQHVPDIAGAVRALDQPQRRVMLAIGRMYLADFIPHQQHFYLLRLVDAPEIAPDFSDYAVEIDRGPFTIEQDIALLQKHQIDLIVSKNSGGSGAAAKLAAARELGIEIVMIARPDLPKRAECHHPDEVLNWLSHNPAMRGV